MKTQEQQIKATPASGWAHWLRSDADTWEALGKHLGFIDAEDEASNAERVAGLRAASNEIDAFRASLAAIHLRLSMGSIDHAAVAAIKSECEHVMPDLAHIGKPNTVHEPQARQKTPDESSQ